MHSLVLFGVTFFGIVLNSVDVYSPIEKCVYIRNYKSGKIECEQGKHIHIEQIWLDLRNCPPRPSIPSSIKDTISTLACESSSTCTVPFKSFNSFYRYLNIRYQCTDCLSVTHGEELQIVCEQNSLIRIQDVWQKYMSACPAFYNTHTNTYTISDVYSKCNGKRTCNIPKNNGNRTLSVYFLCEGLSTTNNINVYTTTSSHSVTTTPMHSLISITASLLTTVDSTVLPLTTSKEISGGLIAGAVVAGMLVLFLALGILFYRRRCSDPTKIPRNLRNKFVTRSNPAYESDMNVGTDETPNKNMDNSLYHEYFVVQNDQDVDRARHNYVNTDSITYDYASEIGPFNDDAYDKMRKGVVNNQQSEVIDSNTYSHLQDTCNDFSDNTYDIATHNRVPGKPENDYSLSRGQMLEDNYDVSRNHNSGSHKDGPDTVYN